MNKIKQLFYKSWLGSLYLEFLLWKDRQNNHPNLNYKEINEIVIQAHELLYREGIRKIKRKINSLVASKTKEEYEKKLQEIKDLIPLAEREGEKYKKLKEALYKAYVKKDRDIKNSTDYAKMIEKKIDDVKKMWKHKEKRELLRKIRKLRQEGNLEEANKLEKEFFEKYVYENKNNRRP